MMKTWYSVKKCISTILWQLMMTSDDVINLDTWPVCVLHSINWYLVTLVKMNRRHGLIYKFSTFCHICNLRNREVVSFTHNFLTLFMDFLHMRSNATECHFGSKRMLGTLLQTPQSILTVSSFHRASQSNPTKHHIVVKEILQERAINCLKNVRIWSFSGPYFPEFGLNADQKKLRIRTLFTQCKLPEGLKDLTRLTKK